MIHGVLILAFLPFYLREALLFDGRGTTYFEVHAAQKQTRSALSS